MSQEPTNKVKIQDDNAFFKVVKAIYEGDLDFSTTEKMLYTLTTGVALYFAWESAKFYLDTGGDGTKYLPIGTFSKAFGGQAAFWCNMSLNSFFVWDTLITLRNMYYKYKLANKLGIPISLKKERIKLISSFLFAAISGVMMGFIDAKDHNLYNAFVMGGVSIILSYIGSISINAVFERLYYFFYKNCCLANNNKSETELTKNRMGVFHPSKWLDYLANCTRVLEALPNDDKQWTALKKPEKYQHIILAPKKTTRPSRKSTYYTAPRIIAHIILQIIDKIALWGYFQDTLTATPIKQSDVARKILGTIIFLPFLALSCKVVWDTVNELFDLFNIARTKMSEFKKNPNWSKETLIRLTFMSVATVLAVGGYFIAYVSSNTSLKLNADYDWNHWWNVTPTSIGATAFNGFAILSIIMKATSRLMEYTLYNAEKRQALDRHRQIYDFFESYPDIRDIGKNFMPSPF